MSARDLRKALFKPNRPGYVDLAVDKAAIKPTIYEHPGVRHLHHSMNAQFADWRQRSAETLKACKRVATPRTSSPSSRKTCWPITPTSR